LGAIGFGAAAWALSLRDQFIGWTPAQRQRCLPWVLNNARLERMWQSPQSSIAAACGGWSETTAAYRLFDNESVTVDPILKAHQEQVAARVRLARLVLHVQDTTEADFTTKKSLPGTGPLSEESRQGFFAHNEYVLQGDGLPLGLWHTEIYARDPQEHREAQRRKQLPIEAKESYRWLEGYRRACAIRALSAHLRVISMGDRENDIYEVFEEYQQRRSLHQPAADWIIRSNSRPPSGSCPGSPCRWWWLGAFTMSRC